MHAVETEQVGTYTVTVHPAEDAESPREWDNVATFALNHRRYDLPNEAGVNFDDFGSWREVAESVKDDAVVVLPVWGYDHGGLALRAGTRSYPFDDQWDSGQAGIVYVTKAKAAEEYAPSTNYPTVEEWAIAVIGGEVETYTQYLTGDVYGYVVTNAEGDDVDSCWGFYGTDDALSEGKGVAEWHVNHDAASVNALELVTRWIA